MKLILNLSPWLWDQTDHNCWIIWNPSLLPHKHRIITIRGNILWLCRHKYMISNNGELMHRVHFELLMSYDGIMMVKWVIRKEGERRSLIYSRDESQLMTAWLWQKPISLASAQQTYLLLKLAKLLFFSHIETQVKSKWKPRRSGCWILLNV